MCLNPGKGRFVINSLAEGDKLDIVVDLIKTKAVEEEGLDLKSSVEKAKTMLSKIPTRLTNRAEREGASNSLPPDSTSKAAEPEPACKYVYRNDQLSPRRNA